MVFLLSLEYPFVDGKGCLLKNDLLKGHFQATKRWPFGRRASTLGGQRLPELVQERAGPTHSLVYRPRDQEAAGLCKKRLSQFTKGLLPHDAPSMAQIEGSLTQPEGQPTHLLRILNLLTIIFLYFLKSPHNVHRSN